MSYVLHELYSQPTTRGGKATQDVYLCSDRIFTQTIWAEADIVRSIGTRGENPRALLRRFRASAPACGILLEEHILSEVPPSYRLTFTLDDPILAAAAAQTMGFGHSTAEESLHAAVLWARYYFED